MKFVDTSLLRIGYEEWNPQAARSVVLLHGWPDSPRTWAQVVPALAAQGWRVLVPALRGFSPTRFLREDTPRSGQLSALGRDVLDFIDALHLQQPALVGHDWGAPVAWSCALLRPDIFHALGQGLISGASAVLVDFHPKPELALVDGPQALTLDQLPRLKRYIETIHRTYQEVSKLDRQRK